MSLCNGCGNAERNGDIIRCNVMRGCRVDGLNFTHCKNFAPSRSCNPDAIPEQTEAESDDLLITGGTVWREDMRPKPEAPRNLSCLLDHDKQDLELAFSALHAIHVRHSRDQHSHDCHKCPAADQAFCAYNTTKVLCEAAGIDVDAIAIWPETETAT